MPRKSSFLQALADCDFNRTPVYFQGIDIYNIVGDIQHFCKGSTPPFSLIE